MAGAGTKEDPWLIESATQLSTLLRTQGAGGYYKLTGNYSIALAAVLNSAARNYLSKIIDCAGYRISITVSASVSVDSVLAGVTLINGFISISVSVTGQYSVIYLFVNCFFTDCLLLLQQSGAFQTYIGSSYNSAFSSPEPQEFRRVVVMNSYTAAGNDFNQWSATPSTTFVDVFKYTSTAGSWYTARSARPTVAVLDSLTSGRFTAAGWFDDTTLPAPRPYFADVINFVITTLDKGLPVSRELMYESGGQSFVLGVSDGAGQLDILLRVRRFLTLRVVATETYALERLQTGNYVRAGAYYLPPVDNGRRYQASSAGQMTDLQSVTFGAAPVVVNGVTLTPSPVYAEVASPRTSRLTGGQQQTIVLDTVVQGGGGPVIEGDPAYLDGVVEEIHPMMGARQALANCEVVAFERRGSGYVAMGSTFSNGVGGFRLETDIYGGGDVFAFAADFPGVIFQPGAPLNVGDRIRPALANGYVYEIVQPGSAGATEPVWWPDQGGGTEGAIGTARARARPYYQPVGHGPLKMTLIE